MWCQCAQLEVVPSRPDGLGSADVETAIPSSGTRSSGADVHFGEHILIGVSSRSERVWTAKSMPVISTVKLTSREVMSAAGMNVSVKRAACGLVCVAGTQSARRSSVTIDLSGVENQVRATSGSSTLEVDGGYVFSGGICNRGATSV